MGICLKKAHIKNFRWHDLHHTWASWLEQSGVPLLALKEMGGWEKLDMVMRYAHLATEHLQSHADILDTMHTFGHKMDTSEIMAQKPPKRLFRRFKFGSPSWARTSDLRINSPSLYRLSYQGMIDTNYTSF